MISKVCLFPTKKVKVFFANGPLFPKNIAFWKISRLRPFVLRVKQNVDKDEDGVLVEYYRQEKAEIL